MCDGGEVIIALKLVMSAAAHKEISLYIDDHQQVYCVVCTDGDAVVGVHLLEQPVLNLLLHAVIHGSI